jgi:hypothetical protein
MTDFRKSLRVILVLLAYLALVKLLLPIVEPRFPVPDQETQFSWTFLAILSIAGIVATALYARAGFVPMWDADARIRRRLVIPFGVGAAFGLVMVLIDFMLDAGTVAATNIGIASLHMPLPEALLIYPAAAIIVEILLRLAPLALLVWLVGRVILRGRADAAVFWTCAAIIALVEPLQQAQLFRGEPMLIVLIGIYGYASSLVQMYFFRTQGFVAALAQRLGTYAVWHVLWGGALAGMLIA